MFLCMCARRSMVSPSDTFLTGYVTPWVRMLTPELQQEWQLRIPRDARGRLLRLHTECTGPKMSQRGALSS
jgi:hypothetical protein